MYLNVQRAALRLGVAPHTVRRWTASGFLPCTRTPGGHRRIRQEDVDELVRRIGDRNHLAARVARERELETLLDTSIALVSQLELPDLLREIAGQLTRLMDCHYCAISTYDAEAQTVSVLAEYDHRGRRQPDYETYHLSRFPLTRRVIEEQAPAVVNVGDPAADPAELRDLISGSDKSQLIVPLVYAGRCIGLLELVDHLRERRYSPQELRICTAIAGQAAVALRNAQAFAASQAATESAVALRTSVRRLSEELPGLVQDDPVRVDDAEVAPGHAPAVDLEATLERVAELACRLFGAASCVVSAAGHSAGHMGAPAPDRADAAGEADGAVAASAAAAADAATAPAELLSVADPSGRSDARLVVSRAPVAREGDLELLGLLAAVAGLHAARSEADDVTTARESFRRHADGATDPQVPRRPD